ncbi:spore maturation protein [Natroniella sp. ANB-PHB2]|uniref:spore maturation protein n=1 Tax=Natroniella sp. ANB-PHB2 TaxID=3384444 RepID=UPI0038D47914
MIEVINLISEWAIPVVIFFILSLSFYKGIKVYDVFVEGAVEGIATGIKIIPYLLAMLVAIGVFRSSGALDLILDLVAIPLKRIGVPKEVIPLSLIRPLSGTGALGFVTDLINQYGPDSFIGRLASTMQGSTETTFYVATVYFGAIKIKNTRHVIAAGLVADLVGFIAAVFICQLVFG